MSEEQQSRQERLEASHPIVKNAARKGLGCGIVALIVVAVVAFLAWSVSPLAPIGVAYSAVGAIPWLIGAGAVLIALRYFTRKK